MKTILVITKKQKKQYGAPIGTQVCFAPTKTIYNYPSGKQYVKHKTLREIYGKAYDWRSDG